MDERLYENKNGLKFDLYHKYFTAVYKLFLLSIGYAAFFYSTYLSDNDWGVLVFFNTRGMLFDLL